MPLQKQPVSVPFAEGLDTKTDPHRTPMGKLTEAENAVFNKAGRIERRTGTRTLGREIEGTSNGIDACTSLLTFGDELLLADGEELYSYLASTDRWRRVGPMVSVSASEVPVVRNSNQQRNPDAVYLSGLRVVAWDDTSGGVRYSVIDSTTGAQIVANAVVSATGAAPKVLVLGNDIAILYTDGTNLKMRKVNVVQPSVLGPELGLFGNLNTVFYDAISISNRIVVVYDALGSKTYIDWIATDGSTSGTPIIYAYAADAASCIVTDWTGGRLWVAWANTDPAQYLTVIDADLNTTLVATSIGTTANVSTVTGIGPQSSGSTTITLIWNVDFPVNVAVSQHTLAGTTSLAITTKLRGIDLSCKAFVRGDAYYVAGAWSSTLQATYFLFRIDPTALTFSAIAKVANGIGGARITSLLSEVSAPSADVVSFASLRKSELLTDGSRTFTRTGVALTDFDFAASFRSVEIGRNLLIGGGMLRAYDGAKLVEHGFHLFPESVSAVLAAGGGLQAGQYQWVATYERTDCLGHVHRSAPSLVHTATAAAFNKATLTIPTLRVTDATDVRIVVYRTFVNSTTFYRVTSIDSPIMNDPTVDSVTFVDLLDDEAISTNELLYTTGGALDNITPDGGTLVCARGARAFVAGFADRNVFAYSKTTQEGEAVAFAAELRQVVDPAGGPITALATMDAYTIIFKERAIFVHQGDGPTDAGFQSDYTDPVIASLEVGCSSAASVVLTPGGLMFKSDKGFYVIDRGLNVSYVGAEVENWNDRTVTGAALVPGTNRVVFTTSNGPALVYDYFFHQWSTFTGAYRGTGAAVWRGAHAFAHSDGRVYVEDSTKWDDAGVSYRMKLTRAWWSFAGINGYKRMYRIGVLGTYKTPHKLIVRFGFDFEDSFSEEATVDVGAELAGPVYGLPSPYGSGTPYGGEFPLLMFEYDPARQLCTSFRMQMEEVPNATVPGASLTLSEATAIVGMKQGLNRIRPGRIYGTS